MTEQKLKELLADMTLEEKVNQMSQVVGAFFNKDMDITAMGPMADKGFTPENVALSGSVLGTMGAETLKKIQKDFVEQHPHHIPMLFMLEVINGFKTMFPIPLGQGATFESELSEKCAAVAVKEAAVSGLHVTFAPMTDLVRDARWGRVMESTGEDPYLNGLFCAGIDVYKRQDLTRSSGTKCRSSTLPVSSRKHWDLSLITANMRIRYQP